MGGFDMTRKILLAFVSALLALVVGGAVLGGQHAPKPPTPPAAALPAAPELAEPPEAPEPPETPEPPEPPDPAWVFLDDGGTWLGVRLSEVTAEKARELKLPAEYGAMVIEVEPDSPAAKAGLEGNDVILEFAGDRVRSVAQLQRLVRETPAGRGVALQVSRSGQTRTLNVKLEPGWDRFKMPHIQLSGPFPHPSFDHNFGFAFNPGGSRLGVTGEELTKQLADYFGVKQGKGVLVREVKEGTPAGKAGLKAGDVIVRVGDTEVGSVEELRNALPHDLEEKKKVNLTIVRDRREQTVAVEFEPSGHLFPLQRAEKFEVPEVDLSNLKQEIAEYQKQAGPLFQRELQRSLQAMKEYTQRWQKEQKEWQRALQQQQRELKGQLNRELRLRLHRSNEDVI
jgi:serine protease Do